MICICDMCRAMAETVEVALVEVLNVCGSCHRDMFADDDSSNWETEERWADSLDDCPEKELDAWRKFSRRIREKIESGKSLKKGDIRPRLPLWTR